jgi:hypothetical protein
MSTHDIYTIMVIDDVRTPLGSNSDNIVVLTYRTPEEGLKALQSFHDSPRKLNELWLDHDMGINPETGLDVTIGPVMRWLENIARDEGRPLNVGFIFVHTSNPYAAEGMVHVLSRYYDNVERAELPLAEMH